MLPRLLFSALLVGHALIHTGFISPKPTTTGGPPWPFALDHSWLLTRLGLDASVSRGIGVMLLVILVAGYAAAILATLGFLGGPAFGAGIVLGSGASLVLLALFFHPWLIVGVALDVVLLIAVLAAGWRVESPS
jgi:hypothetical protein